MAVIGKALDEGDKEAAFAWLKLVPLTTVTTAPYGATEPEDVIEEVRSSMPSRLEALPDPLAWTTRDAEVAIADRLSGPLPSGD